MADINFQLQHDPHFWFNLSAGEVSRQLNKIVSLDVIDKTLSNLNAKVAKAKTTVEISQDRLKEAKERRKQLQYAKEMKSDTEHLINLQQKRDRLERSVGDLGQLIETVQVCKQRLENSREVSKNVHKDWEYVRLTRKQHKIVDSRLSDLDEAVIWAEICKTVFSQSCHRLNKARKQLDKVRGSRCPLCNQKVK
jgi:exonuclease VII small subunit